MSYQRKASFEPALPSFNPPKTGVLQRKCGACGTHTVAGDKCAECRKGTLQKQKAFNNSEQTEVPPIVHDVLNSSGQPLDNSIRTFFESRFGHDFSGVRVHTDSKAVQSAQAVNALAYTVKKDLVFGAGQYSFESPKGKRLLAHELTHVVQQKDATDFGEMTVDSSSHLESEAEQSAAVLVDGSTDKLNQTSPFALQKFDSPEHVVVGDVAANEIVGKSLAGGFILLDSHQRDLPEREKPVKEWSPIWRELYDKGTSEQKRFLKYGLTYGEIVALSGDFYETVEHLNKAPLREIYDLIPLIRIHSTTEELQAATGGRYMALAERNAAHFSIVSAGQENNMQRWRKLHNQAIMIARQGNANLAYMTNAAADHFLTDRFASGHLLTPRINSKNSDGLSNLTLNLLALSRHDIDNRAGVAVQNLQGEHWVAYGDEMWNAPQNEKNRILAAKAVRSSATDISNALKQKRNYPALNNQTVFEAEKIVPQIKGAKRNVVVDDSTSVLMGIVNRSPEFSGAAKEGLWGNDGMVQGWVDRIDDAGIKAQPAIELIRMVETLISGVISPDDIKALHKIRRNADPAIAKIINDLLKPLGLLSIVEMGFKESKKKFSRFAVKLRAFERSLEGNATQSWGVVVTGSGDGRDSPATRASENANIWGTFDFAEFIELMELILTAIPEDTDYRKILEGMRDELDAKRIDKVAEFTKKAVEELKELDQTTGADTSEDRGGASRSEIVRQPAENVKTDQRKKSPTRKNKPAKDFKKVSPPIGKSQKVEVGQWVASDVYNQYVMIKYSDGSKRFTIGSVFGVREISNPGPMDWKPVKKAGRWK